MWSGIVAGSRLLFWVLLRHHRIVVKRQVVLLFLSGRWNLGICRGGAPQAPDPDTQSPYVEQTSFRKGINGKCREVKSRSLNEN